MLGDAELALSKCLPLLSGQKLDAAGPVIPLPGIDPREVRTCVHLRPFSKGS